MSKRIDLSGMKFNRLKVLNLSNIKSKKNTLLWNCLCDCGKTTLVSCDDLKTGHKKSCGCIKIEMLIDNATRHGYAKKGVYVSEYFTYHAMIQRCNNPKNTRYKNYGGRGIKVCDRWMESFENFLEDMGLKPTPDYSLDRFPNVNGNYEKSNCRWATVFEQASNTTKNNWIEYNGKRMIISDWAKLLNTSIGNIWAKEKRGHTFEQIYNFYVNKHGLIIK